MAASSGQVEAEVLHESHFNEPQPVRWGEQEPLERCRDPKSASFYLWQTWLRMGVRPGCSGLA